MICQVEALKSALRRRLLDESFFEEFFRESERVAQQLQTSIGLPRGSTQSSALEFFRTTMYVPVVEGILNDPEQRFSALNMKSFAVAAVLNLHAGEQSSMEMIDALIPLCGEVDAPVTRSQLSAHLFRPEVSCDRLLRHHIPTRKAHTAQLEHPPLGCLFSGAELLAASPD